MSDNNLHQQYAFINTLGEARMFKTRQQISKEGARSLLDHLFVSLMGLYVMNNNYEYAPVSAAYAQKTAGKGGFGTASPTGTDLYQTIHTLANPGVLSGDSADKLLLAKARIDQTRIKRFLNQLQKGNITDGQAQQFFYKLEKDLAIQSPKLRATRRLVQNWNELGTQQQQLAAGQITKYYRTNAMRSDMYPLFTKFTQSSGLATTASRMGKIAKTVARKATAFGIGYAAGKATGV